MKIDETRRRSDERFAYRTAAGPPRRRANFAIFLSVALDAFDVAGETLCPIASAAPCSGLPMNSSVPPATTGRFARFADFYPFYLSEHSDRTCRRLHFVGTALVLLVVASALLTGRFGLLLGAPLVGYGFAWLGHFAFEKNRPATFTHPWYSLRADFVLFRDMLTGRIPF
jgi:hypothetical protein